ncbi:hypothetical protein G5I_06029 [Acromyrmex echinatior]|uniref:Uncharacterized protein n=1 Tax=Acromyrmex echinatior TaxID=103372 RepID=F4WJZ5_ACREC|nr:hypothetical protein G5I_06029 [Acromyrmex echinatior]
MQRSSAHTSSWRSGKLRINNPIALSYSRLLRNRDDYNMVKWRDTDKRLARSRRHHPSIAFTLKAIPRRFARLIGIAESAGFCLAILSAAVSCKKKNIRNRALQFRHEMNALYRLNYKINSLPYTTTFAQAAGFKVTWELPITVNQILVGRGTTSPPDHDHETQFEVLHQDSAEINISTRDSIVSERIRILEKKEDLAGDLAEHYRTGLPEGLLRGARSSSPKTRLLDWTTEVNGVG